MKPQLGSETPNGRLFFEYLEKICAQIDAGDPTMNPFWKEQLEPARGRIREGGKLAVDQILEALGYRELPLESGAKNAEREDVTRYLAFLNEKTRKEAFRAVDNKVNVLGNKEETEHFRMLLFLKNTGELEKYLAYMDSISVKSSMLAARLYFYFEKLKRFVKSQQMELPLNVIEIGAGSGHFARMMFLAGIIQNYVIVDLPEMLLNSMSTIIDCIPNVEARLGPPSALNDSGGAVAWFVEANDVSKIASSTCDVALNFNSFMEMDREIRDNYIHEIYRICKNNGIFYNVNRRQSNMTCRDGSAFDSNPLLYPYRNDDVILEWQPDEAQQSARSHYCYSPHPSFCISRLAAINPRANP